MVFESVFDLLGNLAVAIMKFAEGEAGLKVLFGALVFVFLFGGSQLVLKAYAQNVRIAITLLIGIMSSVMIPGSAVEVLMSVWGGFFYMLFVGFIPIGLIYFAMSSFKGETKHEYFMKFIFAFIAFIMSTIGSSGSFAILFGKERLLEIWSGYSSILGVITAVACVLWIYYLAKMVGAERGDPSIKAEVPKGVKRYVRRYFGSVEQKDEPELLRSIKRKVQTAIRWDGIEKDWNTANKINDRVEEVIAYATSKADKIKGKNEKHYLDSVTKMEASASAVRKGLDKVKEAMRSSPPKRDKALKEIEKVIEAHNMLNRLEINFMRKTGQAK